MLNLYRKMFTSLVDLFFGNKNFYGTFGNPELCQRNPFPICPNSPNCIRLSAELNTTLEETQQLLMSYFAEHTIRLQENQPESFYSHSVWQVGFFKDDVWIKLELFQNKTIIHLKSASRTGFSDLNVNPKRVQTLLKVLKIESDLTTYPSNLSQY